MSAFNHRTLTVANERALFIHWLGILDAAFEAGEINQPAYLQARYEVEKWYSWIGNARDRAYCEMAGAR